MSRNLTHEKTETPFRRCLSAVSPPLQISKRIFTARPYPIFKSWLLFFLHWRFSQNSRSYSREESSANLLRRVPPQKPPSRFSTSSSTGPYAYAFSAKFETKMNRGLGTKRERKQESDNVQDGVGSFWTVCPYCYYMYEYEIVYLDCCLRCQNCDKAFHAVAVEGPLPKITVVEGKELYTVNLALFKICYSFEEVPIVNDGEKNVDVEPGYKTEDLMDVDAGSSNMQRRRVVANHEGASGHLNIKEFCEKLQGKLSTIEEDDHAKQEISQSQSKTSGELSSVQVVGIGEMFKSGLMADHLENGFDGDSESGDQLEFYMDDDDIYIGLADL